MKIRVRTKKNILKGKMAIISIETMREFVADFFNYLVEKVTQEYDWVWVISSYNLSDAARKNLEKKVSNVFEGVQGDDFDHWLFAIETLQNSKILDKIYDITFLNDSFYGPVYPICDVWNIMSNKKADFWGITKHQEFNNAKAFLQTYFINFNIEIVKKELLSFLYKKAAFENPEYELTAYLEQAGYVSEVFVDTSDLENKDKRLAESFLLFYPYELVKQRRCPFLSRFMFSIEESRRQIYGDGTQVQKLLDFIKNKYPVSYIYKDLIFQHNMYHLIHVLELNFVLENGVKCSSMSVKKIKETAIFVYLYYQNDFGFYIDRLSKVPRKVDVYIYTDSNEKSYTIKKLIKKRFQAKICTVGGRGREWATFLNEVKEQSVKYKYACFMHDKSYHKTEFPTQAYDFKNLLWDNLLPGDKEIYEIIKIFEENSHIGILLPPIVKHGSYFGYYMNFWMDNFENTVKLASEIGIRRELIDKNITPISLGGMFWFRPKALKLLFQTDFQREKFPVEPLLEDGTLNHALERIVPYVAQESGYYSGIVISKSYLKHDWLVQADMIRTLGRSIVKDFDFMYEMNQ